MEELHLFLNHQWFNRILEGTKEIEYRRISPFYIKRFFDVSGLSKGEAKAICEDFKRDDSFMRDSLLAGKLPVRKFDFVVFHRGYSNVTIKRRFLKLSVGRLGYPESEHFPDELYFKIHFSIED